MEYLRYVRCYVYSSIKDAKPGNPGWGRVVRRGGGGALSTNTLEVQGALMWLVLLWLLLKRKRPRVACVQGVAELQLPRTQSSIHQSISDLCLPHHESAQGGRTEQQFRQWEEGKMRSSDLSCYKANTISSTAFRTGDFCCRRQRFWGLLQDLFRLSVRPCEQGRV